MLKSKLKMRFFTSFYYVQNDNKLGLCRHLGVVVLRLRRKTTTPKCESIHELVIPKRSKESHEINQTALITKSENKAVVQILSDFLFVIRCFRFF
jgi:hypothetical protein